MYLHLSMKTGIFRLQEDDRDALLQHWLRLTPEDRHLRFFARTSDDQLRSFAQRAPVESTYGFFVDGKLVATTMLVPEDEHTVEFAVSVDQDCRGHGLGRQLLEFGLDSLEADHAEQLVIHHLQENQAMAALHRNVPARRKRSGGEVDVHIDLDRVRSEQLEALTAVCAAEL